MNEKANEVETEDAVAASSDVVVDTDAGIEAALDAEIEKMTEADGKFKLKGKTYSLMKSFPLTLGDWRKLGEIGLIDANNNLVMKGPETISKFLHHLVYKQNPEIDVDDLDVLELEKVVKLFMFARKVLQGGEPDLNPTK